MTMSVRRGRAAERLPRRSSMLSIFYRGLRVHIGLRQSLAWVGVPWGVLDEGDVAD